MTCLVIVDDHEALREALVALLGPHGIEVVGTAGSAAAALDLVGHTEPDVALVDTRLPDRSGSDLTRELLKRRPDLGVMLYGDSDPVQLYVGLDAGARGYALKVGSIAELVGAIERIAAGSSYVDPRLDPILLSPRGSAPVSQLSAREREVMHLMAEGLMTGSSASRLKVSVEAVRTHVRNVIRKLRGRKR